jgi:hypothetical protein
MLDASYLLTSAKAHAPGNSNSVFWVPSLDFGQAPGFLWEIWVTRQGPAPVPSLPLAPRSMHRTPFSIEIGAAILVPPASVPLPLASVQLSEVRC